MASFWRYQFRISNCGGLSLHRSGLNGNPSPVLHPEYSPTVMVWAWHLRLMQNLHSPWLAELPEYRYCIQKSVAVETMRSTRAARPQSVPPPAKVYSIVARPGEPLSSYTFSSWSGKRGQSGKGCIIQSSCSATYSWLFITCQNLQYQTSWMCYRPKSTKHLWRKMTPIAPLTYANLFPSCRGQVYMKLRKTRWNHQIFYAAKYFKTR